MAPASGFCGSVSYADARAWGPPTWQALHLIAANYPVHPNVATVAACNKFTAALPWMLPDHGEAFQDKLGSPCASNATLQSAMVTAHNALSTSDPWTLPQAELAYGNWTQCLTDSQWGTKEVCRDAVPNQTCVGDQYCTGCIPYAGTFAPKGYCGTMWTANPRLFGPWVWQALHVMAEFFPDEPVRQAVDECNRFVDSLPLMLPCSHCGYHLNETIHEYGKPMCTSADRLQSFLVHAHNRVSQYVHPNRADWQRSDAALSYRHTHLCLHNDVMPGTSLARGRRFARDEPQDHDCDEYMVSTAVLAVVVIALLLPV